MKHLEEHYIDNTLTPIELEELREKINGQSNEELSESIHRHWMDDDIADAADEDQLHRMKRNIDRRLHFTRARVIKLALRGAAAVAVLLIPVLLISTIYLYNQNTRLSSNDLTFTTGKGERATVSFPDGTTATLNYDSWLHYSPRSYNRSERRVSFSGEAYFQVAKNSNSPFIIDADHLRVKVLGTKFDLLARKAFTSATLSLEQGSVMLTSLQTNENVTLAPGQTATLDYASGNITISRNVDVVSVRSWQKDFVTFHNTPFNNVLTQISNVYDVSVTVKGNKSMNNFTGALPMHDLNEALTIICKAYNMKPVQNGRSIKLYMR